MCDCIFISVESRQSRQMSNGTTEVAEKTSPSGPSEAKRFKSDDFSWEDGFTDITLMVEDRPIHTNKGFLMASSPIFKTMFLSAYKEKKAKEIPLPGKNYADFVQFLKYLSQDVYTPFTDAGVFAVIPLAWEYQTLQLVERCEAYLVDKHFCYEDSNPSLDLLLDFLHMDILYQRKTLGKKSLETLKFRTQKDIRKLEKFKTLPTEYQMQILASRVDTLEYSFKKYCVNNRKAFEELFKS